MAEGDIVILSSWVTTNISNLRSGDRIIRKNFLKDFQKKLDNCSDLLGKEDYQEIFSISYKTLLGSVQDSIEKCRELSADILYSLLQKLTSIENDAASLVIGTLLVCIGPSDERENSEEVRLTEIRILTHVVEIIDHNDVRYMDDITHILAKCIIDSHPEIKYHSCECASQVAEKFRRNFHMCSTVLINPLLQTIIDRHSKVRVSCIMAIGYVIWYGDNTAVKEVVSHLAQRLFDQSPPVRLAVVGVVGITLTELPDRYSYFPQLIPLLLSGLSDEIEGIRSKASALWEKSAELFVEENEKDFKDQLDFPQPTPEDYPGCRPSFSCRVLAQRYCTSILPAILHDISDWLPETRIKAAQLLYTLMLHCEEKVTISLSTVIDIVVFAVRDEEKKVVEMGLKAAELIGYFIDSDLWSTNLLKFVQDKPNSYHLNILAAAIRGHRNKWTGNSLESVCKTLADPGVCRLREVEDQATLLLCIEALLIPVEELDSKTSSSLSYFLFVSLVSVAGMSTRNIITDKCDEIKNSLCDINSMNTPAELHERYALQFMRDLVTDHELWMAFCPEASIFMRLTQECYKIDEVVGFATPVIINILQSRRGPKLRNQFLSLAKVLLEKVPIDKNSVFSSHVYRLIHDGILSNLHWSAGKTSSALRTIAAANLWEVVRTGRLDKSMLHRIADDLLPILNSLADDDMGTTRLLACKILEKCLPTITECVDENKIHNVVQEYIRCLDDEFDDARVAATGVFRSYLKSFPPDHQWVLYRSHLQRIYKNMLIHMDDPKPKVRMAILDVLKDMSSVLPETLLEEAEAVKNLMDANELCTELIDHMRKHHLN